MPGGSFGQFGTSRYPPSPCAAPFATKNAKTTKDAKDAKDTKKGGTVTPLGAPSCEGRQRGPQGLVLLCVLGVLCVPSAPKTSTAAEPLFIESAEAAGLVFTHINGATGNYYLPEVMGAGVAWFDYDNDGDLDVFIVQGGPLSTSVAGAAPAAHG